MDRNDEYKELLTELESTPLKLDFTLDRARLRLKQHRRRVKKAVFAPLGALAAVFAVFVLLVNVSPTFAYAAGRIPVLRELAQFVALSPSLSAAVENEYVQPIGQEQTANGITAKVVYVIVDQKQLNIFYTLNSDTYSAMQSIPEISGTGAEELTGFSIVSGDWGEENGALRKATVDFPSGTMPDSLVLRLKVYDNGVQSSHTPAAQSEDEDMLPDDEYEEPEIISEFSFTLPFDPKFTSEGETITLDKDFIMDGQKLTLVSAEIYPTTMRFTINDYDEDTAWLKSLSFYVEDENGNSFESGMNNIVSYGSPDSPMTQTFLLESPFFSGGKHLTLYITGVTWLDKDMEKVRIDLANKTADSLPEGVSFDTAKKMKNGWSVGFSAPALRENQCYQLWSWEYYDSEGNEYDTHGCSSYLYGQRFDECFQLKDYLYDEVWLCPAFSRRTTLDTPISIEIN